MTEKPLEKHLAVVGARPRHVHTCTAGHTWECNSPYCIDVLADCVAHGGDEPIREGREPWRGR